MRFRRFRTGAGQEGLPSLAELALANPRRRRLIAMGIGGLALQALGRAGVAAPAGAGVRRPVIGFAGIPPSQDDAVRLPTGYRYQVLFAWGDPVSDGPGFRPDASNSAADQALQAGMHHDGMHFFPFAEDGAASSTHGLLCVNHEYTDEGFLHRDGRRPWSAEKLAKSQAAHGVSVIEARLAQGRWQVVRPSKYGRRITARTPMRLSGPAAAHALLRTAVDPEGLLVLGTIANCAHGVTPWGTYLTCEENFHGYFASAQPSWSPGAALRRYGLRARGYGMRWNDFDARFDLAREPNEPNRFGWVVEIDPWDPGSTPVKRTALGRFKHECAAVVLANDGRAVVYMGDDEGSEYLYKFVSRERHDPGAPSESRALLDSGTLFVARFEPDGSGRWIALEHGKSGLTAAAGFADQGELLIHARLAADRVGATPMDRPEWIAVHPATREAYVSLTNNHRSRDRVNAANPRADNIYGHILRWREAEGDAAAARFEWDLFALCGDPRHPDPDQRGNVRGDAFGSPDALWFDRDGRLWIQTDVLTEKLNRDDYAAMGNNQMLCADVSTGEVRRFLTGPRGCEITGAVGTPDGRNLFLNIQHPGEGGRGRHDPDGSRLASRWPDGGRPRSATIVIRRDDGGVIGS